MKSPARYLLIMVLPFVAISTAHARPWWQAMDVETANPPSRYGYHVSRTDAQDKDRYVITIDPAAAALLTGASIIWTSEDNQPRSPRKMEITKLNGETKIEFTVPPEYLQPNSYLQLDSGPVKYCGPENTFDFNGYRLRLDNIPRDSGQDISLIPTVRLADGAFEFSYNVNKAASPFGGPQTQSPLTGSQLISLESTTQSGLLIPMRSGNLGLDEPVKFVLPKEQVADFMLVITQTVFSGAKPKKQYVGLGILAANAELAAEEKPTNTPKPDR